MYCGRIGSLLSGTQAAQVAPYPDRNGNVRSWFEAATVGWRNQRAVGLVHNSIAHRRQYGCRVAGNP